MLFQDIIVKYALVLVEFDKVVEKGRHKDRNTDIYHQIVIKSLKKAKCPQKIEIQIFITK